MNTPSGSAVAEWCILDVLGENGKLKRILTSEAVTDKWIVETVVSDGTDRASPT